MTTLSSTSKCNVTRIQIVWTIIGLGCAALAIAFPPRRAVYSPNCVVETSPIDESDNGDCALQSDPKPAYGELGAELLVIGLVTYRAVTRQWLEG